VLSKIRRGESVEHYETLRRRKDGSLIPISLTVSPIRTPEGAIIGVSKIARDITERRQAEAALAAAEARHNDLQERLMMLVAASGIVFESPRLQDVLPAIITLAQWLVHADGYAIWRFDAAGDTWHIGGAQGVSDE